MQNTVRRRRRSSIRCCPLPDRWVPPGRGGSAGRDRSSERKDQEEKAFEWYSKGAEEGNENAIYFLAQSYEYGAGVQANREKAIEWYQKVVDCHGDEEEEAKEHLQALLKEIEEG